jgi:pSer/pThr/pTyr-binding forkhead associated (FHA) protein
VIFQLSIVSGKMAGQVIRVRHFPFVAGRSGNCDLVLPEQGVWQKHLELRLQDGRCAVRSLEEAALGVNGQPVREAILRNGDQIEIGSMKLRFGLGPVVFRAARSREMAIWAALGAVFVFQFWLIYRLLG